ncbi:Serine protease [Phytophthora megakarya]|uniref:Serine protease n=1 Tax=Phytophthora megakarya TaxID=4795 RepID=A0A225UK34_9STRA|nr:Serine protease [Phytophthora megakarya]
MLRNFVIALAMIPTLLSAFNTSSSHKLNGWYPCTEYTFDDAGSTTGELAQCAVYSAPLCYPGICETPEDVNPMVDIFVKRLPATTGDSDNSSNVWLLDGGPGVPSTTSKFC